MRISAFTVAMLAVAAIAPAWASADEQEDKDFARQIAMTLRDSGQMQNYSVGVKCKDGTVWVAGRVASETQMNAALEIVQGIPGIDQIVNAMTVGGAATQETAAAQTTQTGYAAPESPTKSSPIRQVAAAKPTRVVPQGTQTGGYAMLPQARVQQAQAMQPTGYSQGRPLPAYAPVGGGVAPASYDQPNMPNYAWPSYTAYPNYAGLTYPRQYSATAWPFIGPFYPYPQVPMGWRKVSLEWDDGWWFLDFQDRGGH